MVNQKTTGALPDHRIRPVLAPINRSAISVPCPQRRGLRQGIFTATQGRKAQHNGPNLEIFQTFTSVDYTMRVQRTCAGYFFPPCQCIFYFGTNAIFLLSILARTCSRVQRVHEHLYFFFPFEIYLFFLLPIKRKHQAWLLTVFNTTDDVTNVLLKAVLK